MEVAETRLPFITGSSFWTPRRKLLGDDYSYDPFIFWLFEVSRPHLIIDLGGSTRDLFMTFAEAIERHQLNSLCISIDLWRGRLDRLAVLKQYCDKHYGAIARINESNFAIPPANIADKSVDILHLGGNHSVDEYRTAFSEWLPKISLGGIILISDIERLGSGISQFWALIKSKHLNFEFIHHGGLAILTPHHDGPLPSELLKLVSFPKDSGMISTVRSMYERLGGAANEEKASIDLQISNKQSDFEQRIQKMHKDRIAYALEREQAHGVTVQNLTKDYAQLKKHSLETIDKLLATQTELDRIKAELEKKQNHIREVELVHVQATKYITRLNADITYLQGALESARRWSKKPWFRRVFSRWKAPKRNST